MTVAPVILPQGAIIRGINVYYYDTVAGQRMFTTLWRNDHDFFRTELVALDSPDGTAGGYWKDYAASAAALADRTVDNSQYSYWVETEWSAASTDLRLMAVRIYYEHPD